MMPNHAVYSAERRWEFANKNFGYSCRSNLILKDAANDISGLGHLFSRTMANFWTVFFEFSLLVKKEKNVCCILRTSIDFSQPISGQLSMDGPCYRRWMALARSLSPVFEQFEGVSPLLDQLIECCSSLLFLLEESTNVTCEDCFFVGRRFGALFFSSFGDHNSSPSHCELSCMLLIHFTRIQSFVKLQDIQKIHQLLKRSFLGLNGIMNRLKVMNYLKI